MKLKKMVSVGLVAVMALQLAGCGKEGNTNPTPSNSSNTNNTQGTSLTIPTIDAIKLRTEPNGEGDYTDLTASIKVLTNRTDIVDTKCKEYADAFMSLYPNIKVEYEGITDYEQSLQLRLTTGDWGDVCFIPTSVSKMDLSKYFTCFGDFSTLDPIYNFCTEKSFEGKVYGIANGGTAGGYYTIQKSGKQQELQNFQRHQMNF